MLTKKENNKYKAKIRFTYRVLVVLTSFAFIVYRLYFQQEIKQSFSLLFSWNTCDFYLLIVCFILMTINWTIESIKWKLLIKKFEIISLRTSIKSIFISLTYSIFTPYRLGEYFGRLVLIQKENKPLAVLSTFVGSISQSIITFGMGLFGLLIYINSDSDMQSIQSSRILYVFIIAIIIYLTLIIIYFNPSLIFKFLKKINYLKIWTGKFEFLLQYKLKKLFIILIYSQLRYFVFFIQYFILLNIFDIQINIIEAFSAISLSYLFLFSIPGISAAEIGIRGSLAIYFIGKYTNNELAILASSTTLWIINLVIPSIIGSVLLLNFNNNR